MKDIRENERKNNEKQKRKKPLPPSKKNDELEMKVYHSIEKKKLIPWGCYSYFLIYHGMNGWSQRRTNGRPRFLIEKGSRNPKRKEVKKRKEGSKESREKRKIMENKEKKKKEGKKAAKKKKNRRRKRKKRKQKS